MSATYKDVKKSVTNRVAWVKSLKEGVPCSECGKFYDLELMHWHHKNPTTKLFGISKGSYRHSRQKILEEIQKCILICKPCHVVEHTQVFACGTTSRYRQGCRCDECRKARRDEMRSYRERKK